MRIKGKTQAGLDAEATVAILEAEEAALLARLAAIDAATVRPLRATLVEKATEADRQQILMLEGDAHAARERLAEVRKRLG
jgi:hypothetical protein